MISQLLGLNPLAVLTPIARMLRLVPVREHVVLADQIVLHVGHGPGTPAFAMVFSARSQMLAVVSSHMSILTASVACGQPVPDDCACYGGFPRLSHRR